MNAYIDHRLWIAGCEKPAFLTVGARKLIADHSEGIPRNINNLCFNAMSLACALQRKTIDRDIVRDVIADLDLEPLREKNIAALKPEKKSVRVPPILLSAAKKQSSSGGWIPKLAITSALLLAAGGLFVNLNRGAARSSTLPDAVATVSAAPPPLTPAAPALRCLCFDSASRSGCRFRGLADARARGERHGKASNRGRSREARSNSLPNQRE